MTGPIQGQLEEPSQVRRQGVVGSSIVGFGGWWISRRHRQGSGQLEDCRCRCRCFEGVPVLILLAPRYLDLS